MIFQPGKYLANNIGVMYLSISLSIYIYYITYETSKVVTFLEDELTCQLIKLVSLDNCRYGEGSCKSSVLNSNTM